MKNFYIFLDIDGVLTDNEFVKQNFLKGIKPTTKHFKPESVSALNYLFEYLSKDYNVNLVISSVWRSYMDETLYYFKKNKIDLSKVKSIDKTDYFYDEGRKNDRCQEIKNYLKKHKEKQNYLVIDDEANYFDFPKDKKIVTNIYNNALNFDMVAKWKKSFENKENNEIML